MDRTRLEPHGAASHPGRPPALGTGAGLRGSGPPPVGALPADTEGQVQLLRSLGEGAGAALPQLAGVPVRVRLGVRLASCRVPAGAGRHAVVVVSQLVQEDVEQLVGPGLRPRPGQPHPAARKRLPRHVESAEHVLVVVDVLLVDDLPLVLLLGADGDHPGVVVPSSPGSPGVSRTACRPVDSSSQSGSRAMKRSTSRRPSRCRYPRPGAWLTNRSPSKRPCA
jgi:hypothetical protein